MISTWQFFSRTNTYIEGSYYPPNSHNQTGSSNFGFNDAFRMQTLTFLFSPLNISVFLFHFNAVLLSKVLKISSCYQFSSLMLLLLRICGSKCDFFFFFFLKEFVIRFMGFIVGIVGKFFVGIGGELRVS